jgi:hypothetical protein
MYSCVPPENGKIESLAGILLIQNHELVRSESRWQVVWEHGIGDRDG